MLTVKKPFGFAGIDQAAEFFGVPKVDVRRKAKSGAWPSYVIDGRRVFDLDELVSLLVRKPDESDEADVDESDEADVDEEVAQ